jgi:hypothetical protein
MDAFRWCRPLEILDDRLVRFSDDEWETVTYWYALLVLQVGRDLVHYQRFSGCRHVKGCLRNKFRLVSQDSGIMAIDVNEICTGTDQLYTTPNAK